MNPLPPGVPELSDEECQQLRSAPLDFNAMLRAAAAIGAQRGYEAAQLPKEPTPAMCDALRIGSRKDWPSDELCRVRYAALLAALPTPPKEQA